VFEAIPVSPEKQHFNYLSLHAMNFKNDQNHVLSIEKSLFPEQEELISRLVYFQEKFERPSEEDLQKISSPGLDVSESDARFKHITEMTILTILLIVKFSKTLQ